MYHEGFVWWMGGGKSRRRRRQAITLSRLASRKLTFRGVDRPTRIWLAGSRWTLERTALAPVFIARTGYTLVHSGRNNKSAHERFLGPYDYPRDASRHLVSGD